MKLQSAVLFGMSIVASNVNAVNHPQHHHDHIDYSPVSVMGSHTHSRGSIMFSYRFMQMQMDGMREGTDDLTDADVLQDFMVTPTRMSMQMHMFGVMYAPADNLTLMAMLPLVKKNMDHVTRMGVRFTTGSEGLGDIKISGLYVLRGGGHHQIHLNAGVSLPAGDINEKDDTPAMANAVLPYPMQLGSGSWDLLPGITYTGHDEAFSWGAQAMATVRLHDNDNDYRLGNRLDLTAWGSRKITRDISGSLRLKGMLWGDIEGEDARLNPRMVPTADTGLQGGKRIDLLAGVNLSSSHGFSRGHRLAIEVGVPLYEDLDGPQMSTQWLLSAGWQYVM